MVWQIVLLFSSILYKVYSALLGWRSGLGGWANRMARSLHVRDISFRSRNCILSSHYRVLISLLALPRICLDRWVGFFPFLFFCGGDFPYVIANSFFWGTKVNNWASLVAQLVKNPPAMQETWVQPLGWEDPLKKGKATHSNILVWRISWTVQFMGT